MKRILITILMIPMLLLVAFGQDPEKKQYQATKISTPPLINGILDDDA